MADTPPGRRVITLGGRSLASVSSDRSAVNVVRATSAEGLPAIDVLAGIAARDPSGLIFMGNGTRGLAFALDRGRVISAYGNEPRGSMSSWSTAGARDEMQVWVEDRQNSGPELLRAFIQRCLLDRLCIATQTGSILTLVRGDVQWVGAMLERSRAPSLQHVLMEHARETDEVTRIGAQLGSTSWVVKPGSPPEGTTRGRPTLRAVPDDEASFGDLAATTHADESSLPLLAAVWRMCDGEATVEELASQSVFGRAPTMRALLDLESRGNVEFVDSSAGDPAAQIG